VPGFAGQQVSLATDGEEIDWLKKRNIRVVRRPCVTANWHQKAEVLKSKARRVQRAVMLSD
jgi:hypothetical protein